MDTINLANWSNIFGEAEQRILFASERYTDLQFRFEEPGLASGCIQSVTTPGMQLMELCMESDHAFQLVDEPKETTESVFVLDGSCESRLHNIAGPLSFASHQHNLQYNDQFGGSHTIRSPRFHALSITYDLQFLDQLFRSDDSAGLERLANCVHQRKTYLANEQAMRSGGRIADVITAIRHCRFKGATRYLFLESKMMELFVLQVEEAQVTGHEDRWSVADRERLYAVNNYIETSYLEAFSLKDLTLRFGLNEFKLKKGYKQLFQTTVFGHVQQLRMQKARAALQEQAMNVSEAAFFIGYDNVSSFCTAFKKQFGYSPGRYKV